MGKPNTTSNVVKGFGIAILVLLLIGTIFIGFIATAFGGIVAFCFMAIIAVFWLFCIFSLSKILKLKPRLIIFGSIEVILIIAFIITNTHYSREREREQEKIRQIESEMRLPGVNQHINLQDYEPFREGARVARFGDNVESTLQFTDKLPRLDGATALYPVYAAFVQSVYPSGDYSLDSTDIDYRDLIVRCSTTGTAYENLINGDVDIIFVAGISNEHNIFAQRNGIELEFTPIGRDAFVFFVNSANPVNSLTTAQIRDIYSGKITNWQELGGEDVDIFPYQREANSGSQTAMENLMGDTPLMRPPMEDVVEYTMEAMIFQVESTHHRNRPNAIGYSFLYFTTEMARAEQIKLLSLDGVAPTRENIVNGTYPQSGYFYAVTVKGSDEDNPNISAFIEWILSEQGQYLIEKTGYTPLQ